MFHPWRAIAVAPRAEIAVATKLDEAKFISCCPRYNLIIVNRGYKREVVVPFVSSYVFARFDGDDAEVWHLIKDINGVTRILVGQVTEEEIRLLRHQVGDETGVLSHEVRNILRGFQLGDKMKLTEGVFKDFHGTIESIDDDLGVVGIKTSLLGREMTVNQPLAWCERVAPAAYSGERLAESSRSKRRKRRLRSRISEKVFAAV